MSGKLADRITNLEPPPPSWSSEKRADYAAEAHTILDELGEASEPLKRRLAERLRAYEARISVVKGS